MSDDAAATTPIGSRSSDATRYLCVAARADATFADRVTAELLDDDLRAVAPSVGFDVAPVLRHCLAAQRQRRFRDVGLLLAGGCAIVLAPAWTVLAGILLAIGGTLTPYRQGRYSVAVPLSAMAVMALASLQLLFFVRALGAEPTDPDAEPIPSWLVGWPWLALCAGLVAYLILVRDLFATRRILVTELRRDRFRPDTTGRGGEEARHAARLAEIDRTQAGNVSVYGGYAPFVGYGTAVTGWSFALPILPSREPAMGGPPPTAAPFDVIELVDRVRRHLADIAKASTADSRLPADDRLEGLVLQDRVFISGDELTGDSRFLPHRTRMPLHDLPQEELEAITRHPQGVARHYLCALVPSWGGEVVASTFLHFSTDGRLLYLECARAVLEPVRRRYHDVDRLTDEVTPGQAVQMCFRAAQRLLGAAIAAPFHLLGELAGRLSVGRRRTRIEQAAREDLGHNYGALLSVRELAVDPLEYHNYFQLLDTAKHLKIVERHVLATILDFLDEHGVDTAEFRNRQTTILNEGVLQTGGLSVVGNQAVGAGARVGTPPPAAASTGGERVR